MGKENSFRSQAVHFVSDVTTVLLNPISDKPSKPSPTAREENEQKTDKQVQSVAEEDANDLADGPDTSSFTAFLYSLLSSSNANPDEKNVNQPDDASGQQSDDASSTTVNRSRKSLFSRGRQSLKTFYHAAQNSGYRNQEPKSDAETELEETNDGLELRRIPNAQEPTLAVADLPEISETSLLLSDKTRRVLYSSLPALVQGRKWLLLYSTWRNGISLSTLYRRSMIWPGLSLLVVGDRRGAVFGGLVEAPLKPTSRKKYQGTNSTFVFTNTSGQPAIFRPTGANRYFTLCSTESLAIGGGGHFALYLDGDLLNGSSSVSETYGNPCLACSEDFEVKEIELWGFVYGSKYEEVLALSKTEIPGICRW